MRYILPACLLLAPFAARADAPVDQSKSEAFRATTFQQVIDGALKAGERNTKLGAGEIFVDVFKVPGFDTPAAVLVGVIDAPPADAWKLIEHCTEYKKYMPRISESDELSNEGGVIRCRTKLDSPWPVDDMVGVTQAKHTLTANRWVREWRMESGDYKYIVGGWTLVPFDASGQRTLTVYFIHSEPNAGIPGPLREMAQKSSLPDVIRALRKEVAKRSK